MEDTFGERMKNYEYVTRNYLTNRVPVIIRIDGKAFHNFTKGLDKPCDKVFLQAMAQTTKELCEQIPRVIIGYTQSDEISLVMMNTSNKNSDLWFSNNLSKVISVSASIATLEFNKAFGNLAIQFDMDNGTMFDNPAKDSKYRSKIFTACFDSRAFNIPEEEIINYFIWRQKDCQKNAVSSTARTMFSHSELLNLNQQQQKDKMFNEKGFDFNNAFTQDFKTGCVFIKEKAERVGYDNFGKKFVAMSNKWVKTNKIFEDEYEFFLKYIRMNRG